MCKSVKPSRCGYKINSVNYRTALARSTRFSIRARFPKVYKNILITVSKVTPHLCTFNFQLQLSRPEDFAFYLYFLFCIEDTFRRYRYKLGSRSSEAAKLRSGLTQRAPRASEGRGGAGARGTDSYVKGPRRLHRAVVPLQLADVSVFVLFAVHHWNAENNSVEVGKSRPDATREGTKRLRAGCPGYLRRPRRRSRGGRSRSRSRTRPSCRARRRRGAPCPGAAGRRRPWG